MARDKAKYNEYMKTYMLKYYYKRRELAFSIVGDKCAICESKDNLHIDHIDPTLKEISLSELFSIKKDKFIKELSKCQTLCEKCHLEKTRVDLVNSGKNTYTHWQHGTITGAFSYNCKCDLCKKFKSEYMKEYWKTHIRKRDRKASVA